MTGGHFNYANGNVRYEMEGQWHDEELNELFYDLFCADLWQHRSGGLATALDFWLSGDMNEDDYRERVAKFKAKWFERTEEDRAKFYCDKLQERCNELKAELTGR